MTKCTWPRSAYKAGMCDGGGGTNRSRAFRGFKVGVKAHLSIHRPKFRLLESATKARKLPRHPPHTLCNAVLRPKLSRGNWETKRIPAGISCGKLTRVIRECYDFSKKTSDMRFSTNDCYKKYLNE